MNWIRVNFIMWLISFILNIWIEHWLLDIVCILTTFGFIAELVIEYRKSESLRKFIRNNYIDIILLIPIFKLLRIGRFTRLIKLKRLLSCGDIANNVIEVLFRLLRR